VFPFNEEGENVERPTPNAQSRIARTVDAGAEFEIGALDVGRSAFSCAGFVLLARRNIRRLLCRTLCDFFFAEPASSSQLAR
jgi:hypothetical protein